MRNLINKINTHLTKKTVLPSIATLLAIFLIFALKHNPGQDFGYYNNAAQSEIKTNLEKEFLISNAELGNFGGTLRLTHLGRDPKTLNPWISNDATSSAYANILFEGLLVNDPDTNEVIPHMAKSFEVLDGGKKIIVSMRDVLKWTDGTPITADDVVFTWNELIRDQVAVSSLRDILLVEDRFPKVYKIDNLTIAFETEKVFAPFLQTIGIPIAPKHDIEKFFAKQNAKTFEEKQQAFNSYLTITTPPSEIVSNGAFKLQKIKFGERIEFKKNQDYFVINKSGQRLPYVDKVVYSYILDRNADVFKFLAGESYILEIETPMVALIKDLESKYDFKVYELGPSSGTSFMWLNMSSLVPEPKHSWFNNKNFRQALSYAIDRESIVSNVEQGLGSPLFTAESLRSPFVNEKLTQGYPRNLNKAKELLIKAGFKYGPQGYLMDSRGNRVEFDLLTNAGNKQRELMATIIIDNLQDIGIKVNFKLIEFNNFVARVMNGEGYEAGILGFTGSNEPNNGANVWKSDGRLHTFDTRTPKSNTPIRNWEKQIDNLFLQGVRTLDFNERKKIYDQFQEIVYEELPYIYLSSPNIVVAASNKLSNLRATKYAGIMPNMYNVYLKKPENPLK